MDKIKEVTIGGETFPQKCPENCPGKKEAFSQGGFCYHCPVFNCTGDLMIALSDDQRKDWAKAWKKWFDGGMEGYPEPPFITKENL